jgi:Na+-transporting NADH:ubiquinone oxidoreductase subunit NqrC
MKFLNNSLIFAGFVLLGKKNLSTTCCTLYYGYKRMTEDQGLLDQQKNIMDAAGIEPMTSR